MIRSILKVFLVILKIMSKNLIYSVHYCFYHLSFIIEIARISFSPTDDVVFEQFHIYSFSLFLLNNEILMIIVIVNSLTFSKIYLIIIIMIYFFKTSLRYANREKKSFPLNRWYISN